MNLKTKLRGLSLQAKYTDRATTACWRSYEHKLKKKWWNVDLILPSHRKGLS
jgi:hypothetical protein